MRYKKKRPNTEAMKVNWYAAAREFNSEVKLSLGSKQEGQSKLIPA